MAIKGQAGFTLIEVLLVMALFAITAGLAVVALSKPQTSATVDGATDMLVADIKGQQAKAMAGDTGSGGVPTAHGLLVAAGNYTLFKGASYSAGDSDNFVVTADSRISLSSTLPSDTIVFSERSGDVTGWADGQNTITVRNTATNESKTITINRYGAATVN